MFNYTAARWLWNEDEQLARRRVHFDIEGLMQVAAQVLGATTCVEIVKLPEGNFNKTFLLTMDDGKQAIARLPNPNAGRPHFSTASEVATMDFVRIFHDDLPTPENSDLPSHLYTDGDAVPRSDGRFAVGPSNGRMYFDDGLSEVEIVRGPSGLHSQVFNFSTASGNILRGQQYQPTAEKKINVLHNYIKMAPYMLPKDENLHASVMWHNDLHTDNIFVDPADPVKIVGIIDWQSTHLSPLFLQACTPAMLKFEGPIPESFEINLPDNFDALDPADQENAKKLRSMQSLYTLYEVACFKTTEPAYRAIRTRNTLGPQTTGLARSLFSDGEPFVHALLVSAVDKWAPLVRGTPHEGTPCCLEFSCEARKLHVAELEKWQRSVELMDMFLLEVGAYGGWDGFVNHGEYEVLRTKLHDVRERFVLRLQREEGEDGFEKQHAVFPFPEV
ncbi:hypothetical protein FQN57_002757 [Myotisia sp. PD_48]|nr:hypothetical protein FQN57_002757 [Myotisia sp. PD_48]